MTDLTHLLKAWNDESADSDELLRAVYQDLCRIAGRQLAGERAGHTLATRDLVHEAFLRLDGQKHVDWQNRSHFFAIASRLMRRVLVDHARRRGYAKRGGGLDRVTLSYVRDLAADRGPDLLQVDGALEKLEKQDPELAQIVLLRFFGGFEHAEVAAILDVSEPTVRRRYRLAKSWLRREMSAENAD